MPEKKNFLGFSISMLDVELMTLSLIRAAAMSGLLMARN
jgi:hypothetical protein